MNEELTPIKKLDLILNLLLSSSQLQFSQKVPIAKLDRAEILNFIENDAFNTVSLTDHELSLILDKLFKDEYVKIENNQYYITFEGAVFAEQGGYKTKISKDEAVAKMVEIAAQRQDWLENEGLTNSQRLNQLTGWLVFVTAVLALIQIAFLVFPYLFCPKKCL